MVKGACSYVALVACLGAISTPYRASAQLVDGPLPRVLGRDRSEGGSVIGTWDRDGVTVSIAGVEVTSAPAWAAGTATDSAGEYVAINTCDGLVNIVPLAGSARVVGRLVSASTLGIVACDADGQPVAAALVEWADTCAQVAARWTRADGDDALWSLLTPSRVELRAEERRALDFVAVGLPGFERARIIAEGFEIAGDTEGAERIRAAIARGRSEATIRASIEAGRFDIAENALAELETDRDARAIVRALRRTLRGARAAAEVAEAERLAAAEARLAGVRPLLLAAAWDCGWYAFRLRASGHASVMIESISGGRLSYATTYTTTTRGGTVVLRIASADAWPETFQIVIERVDADTISDAGGTVCAAAR